MGTTTLLDVIGSITTFGLLLLATLRLNASASENNYAYNQNYLLQRNMVVLTVMLEDDLKHVGAGVYDDDGGVTTADTTDLIFRAVLQPGSAVVNTVEWKFESTTPPNTPNTRIHYLSRTVDGVKQLMNLGVTQFDLRYWSVYNPDSSLSTPMKNTTFPNPCGNIGPVSVSIRLESPYKMTQQYMNDTSQYDMVWRQLRTISRNNSIQFPQ
jgi:hypothetical protein